MRTEKVAICNYQTLPINTGSTYGIADTLQCTFHCLVLWFIQPSAKPPTPDGVTKVKPFKFELDSRFQAKGKGGQFVPAAEAVQKFHKTTPERFHSNPSRKPGTGSQRNASLTMPKTPKLLSRERSRPVTAKSLVQKEEEEEKEIKA